MKERIDLVKQIFTGSRSTGHPASRESADAAYRSWRITDVLTPGRYACLLNEEDSGKQLKEKVNRQILEKSQGRRKNEV
jgi:hypothetical protein